MQNFTFKLIKRSLVLFATLALTGLTAQTTKTTITVDLDGTFGPFDAVPAAFGGTVPQCTSVMGSAAIGFSADTTTVACDSVVTDLSEKIAIIDRGTCTFVQKCLNAQNAGATLIIVVTNDDEPPIVMEVMEGEDTDGAITVPCYMVSKADGEVLKEKVAGTFTVSAVPTATFSEEDVVLWGADGEGSFEGGLNGWTAVNYLSCAADSDTTQEFRLWQWTADGTSFGGAYSGTNNAVVNAPTACSGAVKFDSDFYDNEGIAGNFGAGACAAPQLGALISPAIPISSFGDAGAVVVQFYQALRQFQSNYYVGWSTDGGMTWDSTAINTQFEVNSAHIKEVERVILPPDILDADSLQIKFTMDADYYYWIIDDVQILQGQASIIDLGVTASDIGNAPYGAVPASQLNAGIEPFVFTPGAVINNTGFNDSPNARLDAIIGYIPAGSANVTEIVYQDSAIITSVIADSSSNIVTLTDYSPDPINIGTHLIQYTISNDSVDVNVEDNFIQTEFAVTDRFYSRAGWDFDNERPQITSAYTIAGGGDVEFLTGYTVPNGVGYQIDSVIFYLSARLSAQETLAGVTVEAYLYEWNDTSQDSVLNTDELEILSLAFQEFSADETAGNAWLKLPLIDFNTFEEAPYIIPADDKNYLLGVRYRGDQIIRFGFDGSVDQTLYIDIETQKGKFTEMEYPYIGVREFQDELIPNVDAGFLFLNFRAPLSTAIVVNQITSDVEDVLAEEAFDLRMYPNPVSESLVTSLRLEERSAYLNYQVLDVSGRVIYTQRNNNSIQENQAIFNVKQLPVGQYYLRISTDKGHTTKPFVVKR